MGQEAGMNKYELVIILDAKLSVDERKEVIEQIVDVINKSSGKLINNQLWLERQKFTFSLKKRTEGVYYLMNFEGDPSQVEKTKTALRSNEKVLRFSLIKVKEIVAVAAR